MILDHLIRQAVEEIANPAANYFKSRTFIIRSLKMHTTEREKGFCSDDEAHQRFMKLVEFHQRCFTVSEVDDLRAMVDDFWKNNKWVNYHGNAAPLLESVTAVNQRTHPEWQYIFHFETDFVMAYEVNILKDFEISKQYINLTMVHMSEEASEVIKEINKNQRNKRLESLNLFKELADMQAMINIYKSSMSQTDLDTLNEEVILMENKKRAVIHAEVEEHNQ